MGWIGRFVRSGSWGCRVDGGMVGGDGTGQVCRVEKGEWVPGES